jgi:glycosyltransferase involved in cell wall biosynthesis
MALKVCFIGGARYSDPLDATSEKKFRAMKSLAELFVIGFSRDFRPRKFTEHARFYLLPQFPLPFLRYLELLVVGQGLLFWLVVRRGIKLVVSQSPYEGFIAASAIKFAGYFGYKARLVIEVHGDFEESLFLQRKVRFPGLYRFLMNHLARCSIQNADLLRTISNSTKQKLSQWSSGKEIVQFPAWTDIGVFLRAGRQCHDRSRENILYAGVLTPLKGVHHLIGGFFEIADDFPNAQLFIIGKEENKTYAAELRKQVHELGLAGRVRFLESMPQSDLAVWMAKASVLVLPSTSEGLGRVIIEAMATGTPVIGSRVGGIPELVADGARGFLIPPGDESALAEKIRWVLRNPEEARVLGECARVFAEQLFSTESYLKGYAEIFEVAQGRIERREHATSTV